MTLLVCRYVLFFFYLVVFFFFKQKTAYEMRISDWSSDVCSSDLHVGYEPTGYRLGGQSARVTRLSTTQLRFVIGDTKLDADVVVQGEALHLFMRGRHHIVQH